MRRPAAPTAPGAPGERRRPSNCPHCSPSEPVRTQVIPSDRPRGRWRAAAYGPRVGVQTPRTRPQRAAPAGRLPPGIWVSGLASGQRSTDSIGAGDQTAPPGFGHPSDVGSRAFLSTAQSGPGTGARRMSRGSRARPLLDAPNPVDSLDDLTRTLRAGRSRVETTAGMGDCPRS
ncbi:hypothetical protein V6Z77_010189 [Aspergillus fumigatus]